MESKLDKRVSTTYRTLTHFTSASHTGIQVSWWAYLHNFHGRRDMDRAGGLGSVVQKVPGPPLSILPTLMTLAMGKCRLVSEPGMWRHGWWRVGTLEALVEAMKVRGSTEDPGPPKCTERGGAEINKAREITCWWWTSEASGIFLSHLKSVSNNWYWNGIQCDDWIRGKPEMISEKNCQLCLCWSGDAIGSTGLWILNVSMPWPQRKH